MLKIQPIHSDPVDLKQAAAKLSELRDRALPDIEALATWLDDWAVLHDTLDEARVRREIAKDQDLDDEAVQTAHRNWISSTEPRLKSHYFALQQKLAAHPLGDKLDASYREFVRTTRNQVELYHPDATAIQAECDTLVADFYQLRGAQSTSCDWTHPDRDQREASFRQMVTRRQQDHPALDTIIDQLLHKRHAIAATTGFPDFRSYRFRQLNRFSYGPQDCLGIASAVEQVALPLLKRLDTQRAAQLDIDKLRPWDLQAEPADFAALEPFDDFETVLPRAYQVLARLHPDFAADLDFLQTNNLLDLEPRPQKAAFVGYQQLLREQSLPFLFINIRPTPGDLSNLFHELGHASHSIALREQPLRWNRGFPLEFGETAANTFQLICGGLLEGIFYPPAAARRARALQLEALIDNLVYGARGETFLHWTHDHPEESADERGKAWREISTRLGRQVDWSSFENYQSRLYIYEIPHLFFAPFYWIEYLYGQIGALQLSRRFRQDPNEAMTALRRAMGLGSSVPVPELFAAAGISFEITPELLGELLADVEEELSTL